MGMFLLLRVPNPPMDWLSGERVKLMFPVLTFMQLGASVNKHHRLHLLKMFLDFGISPCLKCSQRLCSEFLRRASVFKTVRNAQCCVNTVLKLEDLFICWHYWIKLPSLGRSYALTCVGNNQVKSCGAC